MKNKGLTAFALVLASGALLMTSCGNEKIYPTLNHDAITTDKDTTNAFSDETLDILYEMIHDGSSTGSDIRDVIIDSVANNLLGEFKITSTGIEIVDYDGKTDAEKLAFVKKHSAYWDKKEEKGNYSPIEPTTLNDSIKNRVEVIRTIVFNNVASKLFDEANTDTYKEHNVFKEYKFARDKIKTSDVAGFSYKENDGDKKFIYSSDYEKDECPEFHNNTIIDADITKENPTSIIENVLHLDYYTDYINREILPSITKTLLVEQYIFDNQYAALSRTQARKVNYIEIQATRETYTTATFLAQQFIRDHIVGKQPGEKIDFEILADAWRGIPENTIVDGINYGMSTEAKALLENTAVSKYFTYVTDHATAIGKEGGNTNFIDHETNPEGYPYYKNTQYGKLIEDFAKINTNVHDADSNAKHSEFSNSGAYTVTTGLTYKTRDIAVKDYTTNTWGTKDNGFSSLPANLKTSLFDYSVGADVPVNKELPKDDEADRPQSKVVNVGGHYFLKTQDRISNLPEDTLLHKDDSTYTIYIVEIEHALTQAKLSYNAIENVTYEANEREQISREIGYTMASTDTYKNTAYLHYLKDCGIVYHDQSIYDFMKDTYPDLFEEDK